MRALKYGAVLFLLLCAHPAGATIMLDATANSGAQSAVSSYSFNHTCGGNNRLLAVSVMASDLSVTTAVTYNGVALTQADSNGGASIWYLVNPPLGTHTVQVTLSLPATKTMAASISLAGVSQTSPLDSHANAVGLGSAISLGTSIISNNAWTVDVLFGSLSAGTAGGTLSTQTNGPGQIATLNTNDNIHIGPLYFYYYFDQSYRGPVYPAGATTLSWTASKLGFVWNYAAAAFKPAVPSLDSPMLGLAF